MDFASFVPTLLFLIAVALPFDVMPGRHGAGNAVRWLANRSYNGIKDDEAHATTGALRRSGRAMTLFAATSLGVPVSTTHTLVGAILGVGVARRVSAVRWGGARSIATAWIVPMPIAGLIASGAYLLSGFFLVGK